MKKLFRAIAVFAICGAVAHAVEVDRALAKQYFAEAQEMCKADSGKLWGASLCGPIFFADPQTRAIVANTAAVGLQAQDGLFVGTLPKEISVANTATKWSGMWWTQVMWPLPTDTERRRVLLAHETFHRLQKSFPDSNAVSDNVDSLDSAKGRYLIQMEWRALAQLWPRPVSSAVSS